MVLDNRLLLIGVVLLATFLVVNGGMLSIMPVSPGGITLRNGQKVLIVNTYLLKGQVGQNYIEAGSKLKDTNGNTYVVEKPITIKGELKNAWDEIPSSPDMSRKIRLYATPRIVNSLTGSCEGTSSTGKSITVGSKTIQLVSYILNPLTYVFGTNFANNYKCNAFAPWDVCCYDYEDVGYVGQWSGRPTTKFSYYFNINGKEISKTSTTSMQNLYHDNNIDIYAVEPPGSSQLQGSMSSQFKQDFVPIYLHTNDQKVASWLGLTYTPTRAYSVYYITPSNLYSLESATPSQYKSQYDIYAPKDKFISYKLTDSLIKNRYNYDIKTESSFTKVFYQSPYLKATMYINATYLNIKMAGGKPKIDKVLVYPQVPRAGSMASILITADNIGKFAGKFKFDVSCKGTSSTPVTVDVPSGATTTQVVKLKVPDVASASQISCTASVTDFITGSSSTYQFIIKLKPTCTEADKEAQAKNIKLTSTSGWVFDENLCKWICRLTPTDKYDVDQLSCTFVPKGSSGYETSCPSYMKLVSGKCVCPSGETPDPELQKCVKIEQPAPVAPHSRIPTSTLMLLAIIGLGAGFGYMLLKKPEKGSRR